MVQVDLLRFLHILWLDLNDGNYRLAVKFIEEFGQMLEMTDLGYADEVNAGIKRASDTATDIKTLRSEEAFEEDLRRLLGGDQ